MLSSMVGGTSITFSALGLGHAVSLNFFPTATLAIARLLAVVPGFIVLPCTYADTFSGLVVGIADGDTIKVLKDDKEQIKVRLVEIDAP